MTDESQAPLIKDGQAQASITVRGENNPISISLVVDILGTLFLGILAIMLLVAWERERARSQQIVEILLEERKP